MKRLLMTLVAGMFVSWSPTNTAATNALPPVTLELVAEGLNAPLFLVAPPDGSGRRIIGDQIGLAHVLMPDGKLLDTPFIDLRDVLTPLLKAFDERGLLAMAFHPDFCHKRIVLFELQCQTPGCVALYRQNRLYLAHVGIQGICNEPQPGRPLIGTGAAGI